VKKLKVFLVAALFAAISAANAQVKYVAVVEVEIDARSGAVNDLSAAEAQEITAELRREAVRNLPQGKYNIMTSETVQAQGGAVLEECAEENCVITLGSKIGADYIVRGIVRKFKTRLTLSVEMYETENGNLVASSDPVRSENAAELLEKAAAACANMYKAFMNSQGSAPKAPVMLELEPKPQPVAPKPDAGLAQTRPAKKRHTLAAVGLDAVGAGILVYGYVREMNVKDNIDAYLWTDAEKSVKQRNIAYTVGSIILLSGISVHIFF